jgi:hypothetical protein
VHSGTSPLLYPFHSFLSLFRHTLTSLCRNITNATKAGGWIGILTAIAAWYASAAFVINNTWQMTLLPVGEFIKAAPLSEGPSEKKQEVPTPVVVGYPSN